MGLKVGTPDVKQDDPSHVTGINQSNSEGNYDKQPGHLPDGKRTARASTGVAPDAHDPIDPRMPNLSPG